MIFCGCTQDSLQSGCAVRSILIKYMNKINVIVCFDVFNDKELPPSIHSALIYPYLPNGNHILSTDCLEPLPDKDMICWPCRQLADLPASNRNDRLTVLLSKALLQSYRLESRALAKTLTLTNKSRGRQGIYLVINMHKYAQRTWLLSVLYAEPSWL